MEKQNLNTPILLIGFIRFDKAQKVFDEIKKVKPSKLFLAVDGPRNNNVNDAELCIKTQSLTRQVDWPCDVKTLFQETNLGCGYGPVTAINWFFDNVESGIILEDDCIPDQSFFYFCQELLNYHRYKNNDKIMHISGNNFQNKKKRGDASYYFSEYTHNWGWATWRRAWRHNDHGLISPELRKHIWDKSWLISVKKQKGLAILPNVNLVSNIGSGENATHTAGITEFSNMPAQNMKFPLIHPRKIKKNIFADYFTYKNVFGGKLRTLLLQKILIITPEFLKPPIKHTAKLIKKIT